MAGVNEDLGGKKAWNVSLGGIGDEPLAEECLKTTGTFATLHRVWCHVLNQTSIGASADFFDVGGDSLKAIRMANLAQRAGITVQPADIFSHPVLQDLARFCEGKPVAFSSVGPVSAPDAHRQLTRGEQWFLNQELPDGHLCDSGFLLSLDPKTPADLVERAIVILWEKHEGLRGRFTKDSRGCWQKTVLPSNVAIPFSIIEISGGAPESASQIVSTERNRMPGRNSALFRATLLNHDGQPLLLVVAHYLACDLVSWQILLDDFEDLLARESDAELLGRARCAEDTQRLASESTEVELRLSVEDTDRLLVCARRNGFTLEGLLTAAVACGVSRTRKQREIKIALGRHGRDGAAEGFDMSRAVGRFSYPVMIQIAVNPEDEIEQVLSEAQRLVTTQGRDGETEIRGEHNVHSFVGLDFLGEVAPERAKISGVLSVQTIPRRHFQKTAMPFDIELVAEVRDQRLSLAYRCSDSSVGTARFPAEVAELLRELAGRWKK